MPIHQGHVGTAALGRPAVRGYRAAIGSAPAPGVPPPLYVIFESKGLRETIFDVKELRGKIRETRELAASWLYLNENSLLALFLS